MSMATGSVRDPDLQGYLEQLLLRIVQCEVADRPGRLEPRVVKRRPKPYKLMRKPRHVLKRELRKTCT
jgi:hypothetical protein